MIVRVRDELARLVRNCKRQADIRDSALSERSNFFSRRETFII
jgi:hypothetical protein